MEPGIALHLEDSPALDDINAVERILGAYNRQMGLPGWQSLTLVLRDATGTVVGGLRGNTGWEWLYVDTLAVAEELRGQDWGTRLLAAAEQEAVRRGCHSAYLDTFDFQALPFYQKQGYAIFGTLPHFPGEHTRYFLQKALS